MPLKRVDCIIPGQRDRHSGTNRWDSRVAVLIGQLSNQRLPPGRGRALSKRFGRSIEARFLGRVQNNEHNLPGVCNDCQIHEQDGSELARLEIEAAHRLTGRKAVVGPPCQGFPDHARTPSLLGAHINCRTSCVQGNEAFDASGPETGWFPAMKNLCSTTIGMLILDQE